MKPICTRCHLFFRPMKNGEFFLEGMPLGPEVEPGTADPAMWAPYKLWAGDIWECRGCGATIIVGVGQDPIAEHYQQGFASTIMAYGATFQVNDC